MKLVILILAIVGVTPALIFSAFLLYLAFFLVPSHQAAQGEASDISLTRRVYFTQTLHHQTSTVSTVMWVPLLVLLLGLAFLVGLFVLLYGQS
jgi:hypothetical protein